MTNSSRIAATIRTWRDLPNSSTESFESTCRHFRGLIAKSRAAGDEDSAQIYERALTATCGLAEGWAHDTRTVTR